MRFVWRALLVVAVSVGVGVTVAKTVTTHAVEGGAPAAQVRLASAMAGLFAGGLAGCASGIALAVFLRRRGDS